MKRENRLPRRKWVHPLKGRTIKQAMAEEIEAKIGKPVHESSLDNNNPYEIAYEGRCSWASFDNHSAYWNIHSWDKMSDCLKYGFDVSEENGEVTARDNDWHQREILAAKLKEETK